MALLVLSFVMSVGLLFKATGYIAAGASVALVAQFIWSGFPGTLSLSIPIAALVSALLVFGRLSSDSEISAMRACGVSLTAIMRMPILLSVLLSLVCLHLNGTLAPDSAFARKNIRRQVSAADLLAVIQPGKFIDEFPGVRFFVGARNGSELSDVRILETTRSLKTREIKAQRAVITMEGKRVRLEMFNVTVDPVYEDRPGVGHAERAVRILSDEPDKSRPDAAQRRIKDRQSEDLLAEVLIARDAPPDPANKLGVIELSQARTELSKRTVMALACLCFVAVGVPLGIKAHRRESALGVVFALAIAAGFFLFLIAAESLAKDSRFAPHWLAWAPVGLCTILAAGLVLRNP
jgi:lipopolysaccharide export system permease protein